MTGLGRSGLTSSAKAGRLLPMAVTQLGGKSLYDIAEIDRWVAWHEERRGPVGETALQRVERQRAESHARRAARPKPVYNPYELGRMLRIPYTMVIDLAEQGQLPAIRVGTRWRFPVAVIDEWLANPTRMPPSLTGDCSDC